MSEILSRLRGVRVSGNGWSALCPAHDDHRPSLSVASKNGRDLLFCHAGCSYVDVMEALKIERKNTGFPTVDKQNKAMPDKSTKQVIEKAKGPEYDYTDQAGNILFQILRSDLRYADGSVGKTFSARRRPRAGESAPYDGWIYDINDISPVLYRLPEVTAAEIVYIVEGEKDVETLRSHGFTATCNPFGAGKWRKEHAESLFEKKIVIFPDNDEPGRKHGEHVAKSLIGIAKEIYIVNLHDLPPKGDVTDYFNQGGTVEQLNGIIANAEAWIVKEAANQELEETGAKIPDLPKEALFGLAGHIVRLIEPHTEASNAALLIQLLAGFGCLVGKSAYFMAEADQHHTKIFAVLVGASSKGRKGTSFGHIKRLLIRVDESFVGCVQDGLSSGEGLIHHVRDQVIKEMPVKEKGKIVGYQEEIIDHGAAEKRAFVVEPEFARVLRVMTRDGNTLSSIIRQAWDSDSLRVMTKNPLRATETQISIIGHITKTELERNLDETETANGFANRFLWVWTSRSKLLPEGGNLPASDLNNAVELLQRAVNYARECHELGRDENARRKWFEIYGDLSSGHTGLLGSVTSRAEAQVMRLACLYALLDCSLEIRIEHLNAALALWKYCEDSARYIFGEQTGNRIADTIHAAIVGSEEMSKTQIRDLFHRNATASQINRGLNLLIELGKIEVFYEETEGRPREIYRKKVVTINDKNDKSQRASA